MRRPDRADLLFAAAAAAAALLILGLGAGLTFFSDEWAFIGSRALGDPATWFPPHNEHWATFSILIYRALVETVGLRSYMPYLAVLVALHLAVAALVYVLVRRTSGRWVAVGVSLVVLFLGGGLENLFWAFQIGFVGATAAGLAAMVAFDASPLTARRAAIGSGLILASLATQGGPGLVCLVAVAVELLLDPRRRRMAAFLAFPAAVYVAWYVAIGRTGVDAHAGVFRLGGVVDLPPVIFTGFSTAAGTISGLGSDLGSVALALALLAGTVSAARHPRLTISPRLVGCLVAVVVFYGLIAVARSYIGVDTATRTRYTYIATMFIVVGVSAQIGRPRWTGVAGRRAWVFSGATVLTLALTWNIHLLIAGRAVFAERAQVTRALITVALERPLPVGVDPDRTLVLVPSPNALARLVRAYGSPLQDELVPWAVVPIDAGVLADAERLLREGARIPIPSTPAP